MPPTRILHEGTYSYEKIIMMMNATNEPKLRCDQIVMWLLNLRSLG